MKKLYLRQPVLIYLFGMPGSGKSFLSRQLAEEYNLAHVSSDHLRDTLFDNPRYDKAENQIVTNLMDLMTDQFLNAGIGVIYDISANRLAQRRAMRDYARKHKVKDLMIWLQIDPETAWSRSTNRDKRKMDDKYNEPINEQQFKQSVQQMQAPINEDNLVISGKHLFTSQKAAIQKRFMSMGLITPEDLGQKIGKPELVNLVSKAQISGGRVNLSRRNIIIR